MKGLENQHEQNQATNVFSLETDGKYKGPYIRLGAKAVAKLLENTKRTTNNFDYGREYRNYKKKGDFETALKDFESVEPAMVTTKINGNGVR